MTDALDRAIEEARLPRPSRSLDDHLRDDLVTARISLLYPAATKAGRLPHRNELPACGALEAANEAPWLWADLPDFCPEGARL